jgi:hypothetical protein
MPTPSLILVPARFKTGKLYTPVATTSGALVLGASGDFNVTRATIATRVNANGNIEVVASGIPRLDYPLGGGCPALLVEASVANGILNSEDTATNWILGASLSSGYVDVIGVTGNNLTVLTSGSSISSGAGRLQSVTNNFALASGSTYTISFFLKKETHTIGGYIAATTGGAAGSFGSGFNVSGSFSSGSVATNANVTNRIRRIEQWGTDVFRCSETFTMAASGTLTTLRMAPLTSVTSENHPAVGLGITFAAPQIELGAIPTSFIPTTIAAVTRNADVIENQGAVSGCIGQTEGTIYWEGNTLLNGGQDILLINRSTTNSVLIYKGTTNLLNARVYASGVAEVTITDTVSRTGFLKLAFAYKSGDSTFYINGTKIDVTKTDAFTFTAALDTVRFGDNAYFGGRGNQQCRALVVYNTRLTDLELAALTT